MSRVSVRVSVDTDTLHMTAEELAKVLGVSRKTLFRLKKSYPEAAPANFDDPEKWKRVLETARTKEVGSHQPEISTSDSHAIYVEARARKTQVAAEMGQIQLDATRRNVIRREEVASLFSRVFSIVRARIMKMGADLPCACVGLSEPEIDRVVQEKIAYALSGAEINAEFFNPKSLV
jgi:hypothetical protein